jgi:hypothetical protein
MVMKFAHIDAQSREAMHCGQMKRMKLTTVLGLTVSVLIFDCILNVPSVYAQTSCNYYASPNGTGNGTSPSTPFQISKFWSVAAPGKTLCLLDGIYTGSSSMIDPPDNLSGAPGKPITVKALNDGKVTINGQGIRRPVLLNLNNYFVLEGFNAHSSSIEVVRVTRSHHNVVKRVAAWDAADGGDSIVSAGGSEYTLFEDVAAWGIGRKVFSSSQGGNFTTCRRCWGRWEGSHSVGPKLTYTLAYNNYDMIIENSIGTWSGEKMQETYTLQGCSPGNTRCDGIKTNYAVDQALAIFGMDRLDGDKNARSKILGSIAYITRSDRFAASRLYEAYVDSLEYKDNVAYIEAGSYSGVKTFSLGGPTSSHNLSAARLTGIGGAGNQITSTWKPSNIFQGPASPTPGSIFTSPAYARVCKRYKDGELTNEPLWPWPMNQRIKDAMIQSGRAAVDVTQTVERMFGPVPGECKTDAPSPVVPPAPKNLRAISSK